MKKKATINFEVKLDENNIPEDIKWSASDSDFDSKKAKAVMISIWDGQQKSTLKINLWTKEMMAEEMKFFTFQIMDSLADNYKKSVGDEKISLEIKNFAKKIGKATNVIK